MLILGLVLSPLYSMEKNLIKKASIDIDLLFL